MKYIKTYENNYNSNVIYNIADYIILEDTKLWAKEPYKCCLILNKVFNSHYNVKTFDKNYEIFNFYVKDDDILRLATPDEIEEYKIKINQNKFNL